MTIHDPQPNVAGTADQHEVVTVTDRIAILAFRDDGLWCFRPLLDGQIVWGLDAWGWGSGELN
jgi:hypothetical protein